jgi:hypothetical protein
VTVVGTVVDGASRAAVAGASVWADAADFDADTLLPTATTDREGRFELVGVKPDSHLTDEGQELVVVWVLARAPGYAPTPTRAFAALRDGSGRYEFEISMARSGCSFGGRVLDRDGRLPVPLVDLHGVDSQGNYRFARSDAQGRFEFTDLPVGGFGLLVRHGELEDADGGSCAYAGLELELDA